MRLIDADELMEHAWRDKLDSRELIAEMIDNAPTAKEIPVKIPINVFEQLISPHPKKGHWILTIEDWNKWTCSECGFKERTDIHVTLGYRFCPKCGAKMVEEE